MRVTDRNRFRKDAESRFPIKIDIAVAYGQPWPYADMLAWCFENVPARQWEQHGYMNWNRRDDSGAPMDFSRWYFMSDADAEAFRKRWMEGNDASGSATISDDHPRPEQS
jgi:hypothetical protein